MPRSAKKRHQKKKTVPKSTQKVMQKIQETEGFENINIVDRPEGMVSLSNAIAKIVDPYKDMTESLDAYKNLIAVACIAWNIETSSSLLQLNAEIEKAAQGFPDMTLRDKRDFKALIKDLIKRKQLLYPEDKRLIVNYEVSETKRDFHLEIAYAMPKEEYEKAEK